MKLQDTFKQVLSEEQGSAEMSNMDWVQQRDFTLWKSQNLHPFIIEDKNGVMSFREITYNELPKQSLRNKEKIFVLTEKQAKYAIKYSESIIRLINLKREEIKILKELFTSVLYHKFMKNDFGTFDKDEKPEENESTA